MEDEARRPVREPADVFKRQAKETPFRENQMFVEFSADRMDPCENDALGWLQTEEGELAGGLEVTDKETRRLASRGWRA